MEKDTIVFENWEEFVKVELKYPEWKVNHNDIFFHPFVPKKNSSNNNVSKVLKKEYLVKLDIQHECVRL